MDRNDKHRTRSIGLFYQRDFVEYVYMTFTDDGRNHDYMRTRRLPHGHRRIAQIGMRITLKSKVPSRHELTLSTIGYFGLWLNTHTW
jgi:hypothetical protein